jgi:hypothetical protein
MTKKRRTSMSKTQKVNRAKITKRPNRTALVFVAAFAVIGTILLIRTLAAPAAATGSVTKKASSTIQEPYVLDWSFSKGLKQLERPHVNIGCWRDENGDGRIDTSSWSSGDLAYGRQIYLTYDNPHGEIVINQDNRSGFKGTLSVDLLSGSSKLVLSTNANKAVVCNTELRVWDGNLKTQGAGTVMDKTPDVTLTDTRP